MRKDFLVFGSPLIEQPEIDEVVNSLKSGWLSTGPKVQQFENLFKKYKKTKYALAVNSCTAALHLSLLAAGIKPGDEIIVPTMTFAATANVVVHIGAKPVFADCEKKTINIDSKDIEKKITPKTKAIIPVHFAGRPCDISAIMQIAKKYNLKIIEDCAHAVEAEYLGQSVGTFGDLGCFSFYATKNITTGEGGMVITNNKDYAEKIKILRLHGVSKDAWKRFSSSGYQHYQILSAGYKYNMMDLQAALGVHQLARVNKYWQRRQQIWDYYNKNFKNLPVVTPARPASRTKHAYHLYTLLVENRDEFLNKMQKQNIGVGVHYIALHLHPFYKKPLGSFPNAEWISERTVSLPLSAKLTDDDVGDVARAVKRIYN